MKREILTVWKGKFWQFKKKNFDTLEREVLTVWKGKFWQFEMENFDTLKREILTPWKGKFWQFEKRNFDSLERNILTVWKEKFWQFDKRNFWRETFGWSQTLNWTRKDKNCKFQNPEKFPFKFDFSNYQDKRHSSQLIKIRKKFIPGGQLTEFFHPLKSTSKKKWKIKTMVGIL